MGGEKQCSSNRNAWKGGGLLLLGLFLLLGVGAMAAWRQSGETLQILTVAPYQTEIVEEYVRPERVYGNLDVRKVVHVENTGGIDALIRASVEVAFGDLDEDGTFVRDDSLSTDVVEIRFDETGLWKRSGDGWFYYTEVLKAGERTKVPLMESFHLSPDLDDSYKRKEGRIFVRMESLQAGPGAESIWTDSNVRYEYAYQEALDFSDPVSVVFLGPAEGFDFEGESSDIFASFRYLSPGCARSQRIVVKNDSQASIS